MFFIGIFGIENKSKNILTNPNNICPLCNDVRIKLVQEKLRKFPIRIKIKERVGELNHDETT
ncbi:hypothetical protein [Clostridium sp.]|uniref:hypothetical protein n=1 Tax=Clostridium sp. TaxID=1506 RepID=UPI0035A0E31A